MDASGTNSRSEHQLMVLEAVAANEVRQAEAWLQLIELPASLRLAQKLVWSAVGANRVLHKIASPLGLGWSELQQRFETASGCQINSTGWIIEDPRGSQDRSNVISFTGWRACR